MSLHRVRTFRVSSWPGPAACCRNRPRRPGRPRRRSAARPSRVCGAARTGAWESGSARSSRSGPRRRPSAAAGRCAGGRPARPRARADRPSGPWASAPGAGDARPSASPPRSHRARWPCAGPRPTARAPVSGSGTTTHASYLDATDATGPRVRAGREVLGGRRWRQQQVAAGCTAIRNPGARSRGVFGSDKAEKRRY